MGPAVSFRFAGAVLVRFKKIHRQSKRGMFLWTCQVRLTSEKGLVYSIEATEFGGEKALNVALDRLSRSIVSRKRETIERRLRKGSGFRVRGWVQEN